MQKAILLAVALLFGTLNASAQEIPPTPTVFIQKIVGGPASEWCKAVPIAGEVIAFADPVNRPTMGLVNASNLYSTVVCSGMIYNRQVFIDFVDDNNGKYITCTLKTWTYKGEIDVRETRASSVYNTNRERSTFYWKLPINYLGYFQVVCRLPPQTAIVGYYNIALPFE